MKQTKNSPKQTVSSAGTATQKKLSDNFLLIVAFLEGAMVIAVELLGAKMISAFFGTSLKIWTAVICTTITFLTIGYFIGGILSKREHLSRYLTSLLALAAIFMLSMPDWAVFLFGKIGGGSIFSGSITCSVFLLGPSVLTLGITSPLIIQLLSKETQLAGWTAGKVYAVSTCAGIVFTLLIGFVLLPVFGIKTPLLIFSVLLMLSALLIQYRSRLLIYLAVFALLFLKSVSDKSDLQGTNPYAKYQLIEEGFLGQLKVLDESFPNSNDRFRSLVINGILQTVIYNTEDAISYWPYVHRISMASSLKKGGNALLFGMGGGSIATELSKMKIQTDIVDIDKRMFDISQKYFYFNDKSATFTEDDARHFMRVCEKKYDLIIFDICSGEVQPSNVFTMEGIAEVKHLLKPGGMILIQYQEKEDPSRYSGSQSIANTFMKQGFKVYRNIEKQDISGIILAASLSEIPFSKLDSTQCNPQSVKLPWAKDYLKHPFDACPKPFAKGMILTDDKPMLEILNAETIALWREQMIKHYALNHLKEKKKLFN